MLSDIKPYDLVVPSRFDPDRFVDVFPRRPVVRILVLVDTSVSINGRFGIPRVISLIRQNADSYVRFVVDLAQLGARDSALSVTASPEPTQFKYRNFRYSSRQDDALILDSYDQLWCFGFAPGNNGSPNDANITDNPLAPTTEDLEVLAGWMNAGGGVLAMGDHHYLGATMCSQIPRVRHMRRWTNAQQVPPINGEDRHDTNRVQNASQDPSLTTPPGVIPNSAQSDAIPQPMEWRRYRIRSPFAFMRRYRPHPVLCGGDLGAIDVFPDHPHEGWVYEDNQVDLSASYTYGVISEQDFPVKGGVQPRPEVISWANTLADPPHRFAKGDTPARRFGMLGVYDGDPIDYGRIIVDSTWHHWMDMNLEGWAPDSTDPAYLKIVRFFRNCAVWLSREGQRRAMYRFATWLTVLTPRYFEDFNRYTPVFTLGDLGLDVIGREENDCFKDEWVYIFVPRSWREAFELPRDILEELPVWSVPDDRMIRQAVMGGILNQVVELRDFVFDKADPKSLTQDEMTERMDKALQAGAQLGLEHMQKAVSYNAKLFDRLREVQLTEPVYKKQWVVERSGSDVKR